MNYTTRVALYKKIEASQSSKVLLLCHGDRPGLETQFSPDQINLFVSLLDKIGPTQKISLVLTTNGGATSAAWRLVNLIRTFCEELEIIIPLRALSAGTLVCLGADKLIMSKQAALGPIDPSLRHPLGPSMPQSPEIKVPVSVEAVQGYLDVAMNTLKVSNSADLATVLASLSNHVHPLVLGEIYRSRAQIRFLADKLVRNQVTDPEQIRKIIDFLCADSGSHDYTINRREAESHGLKAVKPSHDLYTTMWQIHESYSEEMKLLEPYSPDAILGGQPSAAYSHTRALVESTDGGSYAFLSEGTLSKATMQVPGPFGLTNQDIITESKTFEGWRKVA
jgi:hypothetical protein